MCGAPMKSNWEERLPRQGPGETLPQRRAAALGPASQGGQAVKSRAIEPVAARMGGNGGADLADFGGT